MAQQTAVEWLVNQLEEHIRKSAHNELGTKRTGDYRIGLRKAIDFCEQAKQMEKEQAIEHFINGSQWSIFPDDTPIDKIAEQYYNETYNKQTTNEHN